jgi:hypothetical protein
MDDILKLIFTWPGVALIIAVTAMVLFRKQIGSFIIRAKSISRVGIETFDPPQGQSINQSSGLEEFMKTFDNPLIIQVEESIKAGLITLKIESSTDREKALVRDLARVNLILHFERAYGIMWASQLNLLRKLNSKPLGILFNEGQEYYNQGKELYPDWYGNYRYEDWINFLVSFKLVEIDGQMLHLTLAGREFLKYIIDIGKTDITLG